MKPSSIENCAKQLKENDPNLIRLDLSESKLDDSAILETLVEGFEKNIVLRAVDLHGNAFGDEGFQVRMATLINTPATSSTTCVTCFHQSFNLTQSP